MRRKGLKMTSTNIKIDAANATKIEAALSAVNGRATAHAYTDYEDIFDLSRTAEAALEALRLPKTARKGAAWTETSGGAVTNSYARKGRTRTATTVRLERRAKDWYLVSAVKDEIYQQGGGKGRLTISQAQADDAVARLRATFTVRAESGV